jgi:UDP-N-acetylmuramate dehydrogenase
MKAILKTYLEYLCGAENVFAAVPLSQKTTFKIGGAAKFFVVCRTREKLVKLISALNYIDEPWFVIGNGSNILVGDAGFDGVVIRLGACEIVDNGNFIYADAGASLGKVAAYARVHELTGMEWSGRGGVHERRRAWRANG